MKVGVSQTKQERLNICSQGFISKQELPKKYETISWAMALNMLNCLSENFSATALFKNERFSKLNLQ